MAEENLPGPGPAISDKGSLCRVFSPAAPIFAVHRDGGGNCAAEHINGRLLQAAVRNSQSECSCFAQSALPRCIKTTGRLLRSPHRTPLPSSHFAADGQSARPSASFAPPPALGCSCHHYAPVNSLRASGVHRMLTWLRENLSQYIRQPGGQWRMRLSRNVKGCQAK
jgi:hypothetical protein